MGPAKQLSFGPFRLDPVNARLWRGAQPIPLRRKAFSVLRYLVENPQRLVTKAELLSAVWPRTQVSDGVLKVCLREIRQALADDADAPRLIETVYGYGYRLIADVTPDAAAPEADDSLRSDTHPGKGDQAPAALLFGREADVAYLDARFGRALRGKRQVVFVTGEAGIGKTTVVERFLERVTAKGGAWIARGQCVKRYGAGESYLPVLEALGRLGRSAASARIVELLRKYAPTWLVQLSTLIDEDELRRLRQQQGTTQERMLRELVDMIEALTSEVPLVLVLEDLHWADYATLDLVASVAQRWEPAKLCLIGTYRPAETIVSDHPLKSLKHALQLHGRCEELRLEGLDEEAVRAYLDSRLRVEGGEPSTEVPGDAEHRLAAAVFQRTDGNPLFMVNLVDELIARGRIVARDGRWQLDGGPAAIEEDMPETLRQMIAEQLERLDTADQQLLEVASVAGIEFSAAAVAAGLETTVEQVEERCQALHQGQRFVRTLGETVTWPDGTVSERFSFIHAFHQNVLYRRLGVARRRRLHQRIGEREEAGHGDRADDIAATLAVHFEQGRDYPRAVHYLAVAGARALARSAHRQANEHFRDGLKLLETMPAGPQRAQEELMLQIALGVSLAATQGYAATEVERCYARAGELCREVGETPQLFPVLYGLGAFHFVRGQLQTAKGLWQQLLRLAEDTQDPTLLLEAHSSTGALSLRLGDLVGARSHLEKGIALYDPQQHGHEALRFVQDPKVSALSDLSCALWLLGHPDRALASSAEAMSRANELAHPFSQAFALLFSVWLHQFRRDGRRVEEHADAVVLLSTEQGFPNWSAMGTMLHGWALAERGDTEAGIGEIQRGLDSSRAIGTELGRSYYLALLAEAHAKAGNRQEALDTVAEAFAHVQATSERFYEPELHRLKGELILGRVGTKSLPREKSKRRAAEAESCFDRAIEIARRQNAKSLELRASASLSRLWQERGENGRAYELLSGIFGWFHEGFESVDLQEAKTLLESLMQVVGFILCSTMDVGDLLAVLLS